MVMDFVREELAARKGAYGLGSNTGALSVGSGIAAGPNIARVAAPPPEPDGTSLETGGLKAEEIGLSVLPLTGIRPGVYTGVNQRVAFYAAREEGLYVVMVEEAPDWDASRQWRMSGMIVAALVPLLQALGVKLKDCSGELGHLIRAEEPPHEERVAEAIGTAAPDTSDDGSPQEGSGLGWTESEQEDAPREGRSNSRRNRRRKRAAG